MRRLLIQVKIAISQRKRFRIHDKFGKT